METIKSLPCWAKVAAAIFAVIFIFNWPANSGEWAAWVQAVGLIVTVLLMVLIPAADRRRAEIRRLMFAQKTLEGLSGFYQSLLSLLNCDSDSDPWNTSDEIVYAMRSFVDSLDSDVKEFFSYDEYERLRQPLAGLMSKISDSEYVGHTSCHDIVVRLVNPGEIQETKGTVDKAAKACKKRFSEIQARSLLSL